MAGPGDPNSAAPVRSRRCWWIPAAASAVLLVAVLWALVPGRPASGVAFDIGVLSAADAAASGRTHLVGEFLALTNRSPVACVVWWDYEYRDPGAGTGWSTMPPANPGSPATVPWSRLESWDGAFRPEVPAGEAAYVDLSRPALPRGTAWRVRFFAAPRLEGSERLWAMVRHLRFKLQVRDPSIPWNPFGASFHGQAAVVNSPELRVP